MMERTVAVLLTAAIALAAAPPTTRAATGKPMTTHATTAQKNGHLKINGVNY